MHLTYRCLRHRAKGCGSGVLGDLWGLPWLRCVGRPVGASLAPVCGAPLAPVCQETCGGFPGSGVLGDLWGLPWLQCVGLPWLRCVGRPVKVPLAPVCWETCGAPLAPVCWETCGAPLAPVCWETCGGFPGWKQEASSVRPIRLALTARGINESPREHRRFQPLLEIY